MIKTYRHAATARRATGAPCMAVTVGDEARWARNTDLLMRPANLFAEWRFRWVGVALGDARSNSSLNLRTFQVFRLVAGGFGMRVFDGPRGGRDDRERCFAVAIYATADEAVHALRPALDLMRGSEVWQPLDSSFSSTLTPRPRSINAIGARAAFF